MSVVLILAALVLIAYALGKVNLLASAPKSDKDLFPPVTKPQESADTLEIPLAQRGGTINDASAVMRTGVYGIVAVRTEDDVSKSLGYARTHNLKVSIAGARHSMGGQAFARDALVLDMRPY